MRNVLNGIAAGIGRLWSRGCLGKAAVIVGALFILGLCGSILGGGNRAQTGQSPTAPAQATVVTAPTEPPQPTSQPATAVPTVVPTVAPEPTIAPTAAPVPTEPAPAAAPKPKTDPRGVAPLNKDDCPPDYPIKGNIGSNGKIYHVPGGRSYNRTDPERCFATAADAEAAGFRAAND